MAHVNNLSSISIKLAEFDCFHLSVNVHWKTYSSSQIRAIVILFISFAALHGRDGNPDGNRWRYRRSQTSASMWNIYAKFLCLWTNAEDFGRVISMWTPTSLSSTRIISCWLTNTTLTFRVLVWEIYIAIDNRKIIESYFQKKHYDQKQIV